MINRVIRRSNWDYLSNDEIVLLFRKVLSDVTIHPSQEIVDELRRLKIATLELYENRTHSTVYRIRQTGEIFQVEYMDGGTFIFDDSEEYHAEQPIDSLIEHYGMRDPKYFVVEENGYLVITRTKPPRFVVNYHPDRLENIEVVKWHDTVRPERVPKLMSAIGVVADRFLKQEEDERRKKSEKTR